VTPFAAAEPPTDDRPTLAAAVGSAVRAVLAEIVRQRYDRGGDLREKSFVGECAAKAGGKPPIGTPCCTKLAKQPKWRERGRLQVAANSDDTFVNLCVELQADLKYGSLYKTLLNRRFGPKFIQDPEFRTKLEDKFDRDSKVTQCLIRTKAGAEVILEDSLFEWILKDIARYDEPEQRGYCTELGSKDAGVAADLIDAVRRSCGNASRRSFAPVREYIRSAAENKPTEPGLRFKCKVQGCPSTFATTKGFKSWDVLIRHAGNDHPTLPRPVRGDYSKELDAEQKRGTRPSWARGETRRKSG
jgi:hypothetical protein